MVTKKDLIIAVSVTFCLAAVIFMAMPISANNYDPMLDYNHDGKIGLSDLIQFAQSYGASGDPTINVNVLNPTYSLQTLTGSISNVGTVAIWVTCGGYSSLSILFGYDTSASIGASSGVLVYLSSIEWCSDYQNIGPHTYTSYEREPTMSNCNETILNGVNLWQKTGASYITSVEAPYCILYFSYNANNLPTTWSVTFALAAYLRN